MICRFIVNPKLPIFTFKFIGQEDNTFGDLQITEGNNPNIIQAIGSGIDPNAIAPATAQDVLGLPDMNFDGYNDLSILNNCGATGNCNYDIWLYNPQKNIFVENDDLSNVTNPTPDPTAKTISSTYNWGASGYEQDTYKFDANEKLFLTNAYRQEAVGDGSSCKETTSDLVNGKMMTTTKIVDCTN